MTVTIRVTVLAAAAAALNIIGSVSAGAQSFYEAITSVGPNQGGKQDAPANGTGAYRQHRKDRAGDSRSETQKRQEAGKESSRSKSNKLAAVRHPNSQSALQFSPEPRQSGSYP